ncbi:hypothetical protein FNV43_RR23016 [Rhamnella rubrinervis]|uniref:Uncharacterized protein n=1 Tax=Rhamnella rubrinervis TaxID=2594499 RepID=A0A8K0GRN5_9ROSA|nr:hypothetical protein FNV43_RR23016 [Rhamnella rubrinervis]
MAVVFLLKIIFFVLTTISNLVARLIFTTTAYLVVLLIHKFKVSGEAVHGALGQVAEMIRAFSEYLMELVMEAMKTIIYSSYDLLKGGVMVSAAAASLAIWDLLEKTRASLDEKLKEFPEALEGFAEMVSTVAVNLWNSCMGALGYVRDNA